MSEKITFKLNGGMIGDKIQTERGQNKVISIRFMDEDTAREFCNASVEIALDELTLAQSKDCISNYREEVSMLKKKIEIYEKALEKLGLYHAAVVRVIVRNALNEGRGE